MPSKSKPGTGTASARTAAKSTARPPTKVIASAPSPQAAPPGLKIVLKKSAARKAVPKTAPGQLTTAVVRKARPEKSLPIYQIYFLPEQRPALDAAFIPLDNSASTDPLHEFAVFERLGRDEGLRQAPLWGAMSWRFGVKTGLSGQALRQAIAAQPGHDLYYCNPFPEHEALFINSWQQGVPSHPNFTALCTAVFEAGGLPVEELGALHPSPLFSTCNFFVGSPAFWGLYLPWVRGLLDRVRAGVPGSVLKVLDSPLSDPNNHHAGSTYWPFIVERLLPLFLAGEGRELKTHKLALPAVEVRLNTHLQRLREMKDVAHRTRSRWLYACWLNYRNLYLLQTAGPDWCKRYLPLISAAELHFR